MTHRTAEEILGSVPLERFEALRERLVEWALLAESSRALEILALLATDGAHDYNELWENISQGSSVVLNISWAYRLAKVAALLPNATNGRELAEALFSQCMDDLLAGKGKSAYLKLLAELRMTLGDWQGAREVIFNTRIKETYSGYLTADVTNPYTSDTHDIKSWLRRFNRLMNDFHLAPIILDGQTIEPFNQLSTKVLEKVNHKPMVSVILTVFNPSDEDLLNSVNSILRQTWDNLELLVINDCSSNINPTLLEIVQGLDKRVKIIDLPANGGTYIARNLGILAARGEFVAGQDADDWSHPERLRHQIEVMLNDSNCVGVDTRSNRLSDNLNRSKLGHGPDRRCEASLMFRRSDAVAVGGYLPIRKGADSEFRLRLEKWSGRAVASVKLPLYFTRLSEQSLSRSDFRPGWSHQSRRAFYGAFSYWHKTSDARELQIRALEGDLTLPFCGIPDKISGKKSDTKVEYCFLADWRGVKSETINQVAKVATVHEVAIMHVDAPFTQYDGDGRELVCSLQKLINDGRIARVFHDGDVRCNHFVVLEPIAVQLTPEVVSSVRADKLTVLSVGDECLQQPFDRDIVSEYLKSWQGCVVWSDGDIDKLMS